MYIFYIYLQWKSQEQNVFVQSLHLDRIGCPACLTTHLFPCLCTTCSCRHHVITGSMRLELQTYIHRAVQTNSSHLLQFLLSQKQWAFFTICCYYTYKMATCDRLPRAVDKVCKINKCKVLRLGIMCFSGNTIKDKMYLQQSGGTSQSSVSCLSFLLLSASFETICNLTPSLVIICRICYGSAHVFWRRHNFGECSGGNGIYWFQS